MVLSYKELRKRDVVNIADGRSFGKITDLQLDFPCATLKGIVVCDKKRSGLFGLFFKSEIFIDESQIVRIGGDVILVNITHFESASSGVVEINSKNRQFAQNPAGAHSKPCPPCPKPKPDCPPPVPPVPPCPPVPPAPPFSMENKNVSINEDLRLDLEDY